MRRLVFLALCLCPAAAAAPDGLMMPRADLRPCLETLCTAPHSRWERRELLGEAVGRWLGVRNGRWDAFDAKLFEDTESAPAISGTIRKNAAEILLRWRPGD